jgi:hypothetical protein
MPDFVDNPNHSAEVSEAAVVAPPAKRTWSSPLVILPTSICRTQKSHFSTFDTHDAVVAISEAFGPTFS